MITPFTEIEKMEILDLTGKYLCHDASEAIIVSHRETVQNDFHISIRRVKGDSILTCHRFCSRFENYIYSGFNVMDAFSNVNKMQVKRDLICIKYL